MDEKSEECLEDNFTSATEYLPSVVSKLKPDQLLQFYALYKQATIGKCNTAKPSLFLLEAKRKWESWNKLGNMSKEEAMAEYIRLISEHFPDWDLVKQNKNGWVSVSSLATNEKTLSEAEKNIFDRVKEGDTEKVKIFAQHNSVNVVDEDGMGLIHWAADRGNIEMVSCLLDLSINVDMKDDSGQTPLHYASSCGHYDVVKLLLEKGANAKLTCNEGYLPLDIASEDTIQFLLKAI